MPGVNGLTAENVSAPALAAALRTVIKYPAPLETRPVPTGVSRRRKGDPSRGRLRSLSGVGSNVRGGARVNLMLTTRPSPLPLSAPSF